MISISKNKNYTLLAKLGGILLLAVFLRVIFGSFWLGSMSMGIVSRAYSVTQGIYPEYNSLHSFRFGMIYPVALFFKIFGVNLFSLTLYPVLCGLGMIVVAFFLGKVLFNEKVGLIAALLISFYPLNVYASSSLYPDVPMTFFMSLSILLYVLGEKNPSRNQSALLYISSGLSLGLGFLVKEAAALLALFFIVDIVRQRRIARSHIYIALSFLLVLGLDTLFTYFQTGEWLLRFKALANRGSSNLPTEIDKSLIDESYSMSQKWLYIYWFAVPIYRFGFFFYFVFAGTIYHLLKRVKNIWLPIVWFLTLFCYMGYGALITKFAPGTQHARYLCVITVPIVLIIASFLVQNKYLFRGWFVHISILFLFLTSIFTSNFDVLRHEPLYTDIEIKKILGHELNKTIYSDNKTIKALKFLYAYQKSDFIKSYEDDIKTSELKNLKDSFVIVDFHRTELAEKRHGERQPIHNLPQHWTVYTTIDNPAPKLSYLQAKFISWVGQLPIIPSFIGNRLSKHTSQYLEPKDAVIYYTGSR